jgi:hypothetical protein
MNTKPLRLPVSQLKQYMVRTFMFIFFCTSLSGRLEYNSLFVGTTGLAFKGQ